MCPSTSPPTIRATRRRTKRCCARYTDALALINPAFDRRWVKFSAVFRDRFAQPICLTDYKHDHACHPDAGREPLPHRLLPAPSPRPHDQRVVRPGHRGGAARRRRGRPMRPWDRRTVIVAAAAALPPLAFLATGRAPAAPVLAVACIAAITAGLAVLERGLRAAGLASVSVATSLLVLYGTGLVWHELVAPGATALAFMAGALVTVAWSRRPGRRRGEAIARGGALGLVLGAVALLADVASGAPLSLAIPSVLDSLFSSRHGVLFWTPVLTLALVGLALRAAHGHRDALGALGALALLALVNASLRPWWSGGFANARLLPALPLLALGLATLLEVVRTSAERRPLRVAAAVGALLVAWNLLLMAQYRAELIPRDDTVSFPAVAENNARLLAETTGAPTAWPANWMFAAHRDLPVARYDLLGGQDVLGGRPHAPRGRRPGERSGLAGRGVERAPSLRRGRVPRGRRARGRLPASRRSAAGDRARPRPGVGNAASRPERPQDRAAAAFFRVRRSGRDRRPRVAASAASTSSSSRSTRAGRRSWTRCGSSPSRPRDEPRGVRAHVRGRGDAVVVRRDARHQPVPARRGVARRRGGRSAHPGRGLRDGQQPRPSPAVRARRRRRSLGRGAALLPEPRRGRRPAAASSSLPFPDGMFDARDVVRRPLPPLGGGRPGGGARDGARAAAGRAASSCACPP